MPSYKKLITLFAFLCLSFEVSAQAEKPLGVAPSPESKPGIFYALLLKGMPAPFDTTVAIHVQEYRRIRTKLILGDSLQAAKDYELARAYNLIQEKDSAQSVTLAIVATLTESNERLAKTNAKLNDDYDELYLVANKKEPLLKKPWFWFAGGALVGIILKSL